MIELATVIFFFLAPTDPNLLRAYGPGPRFSDLEACESAHRTGGNGAPANAYACVPLVVETRDRCTGANCPGFGGSGMTGGRGGYLGPCGGASCERR